MRQTYDCPRTPAEWRRYARTASRQVIVNGHAVRPLVPDDSATLKKVAQLQLFAGDYTGGVDPWEWRDEKGNLLDMQSCWGETPKGKLFLNLKPGVGA